MQSRKRERKNLPYILGKNSIKTTDTKRQI